MSELLGGTPGQFPERCRPASLIEMLPLGVRQLILHGAGEEVVPVDLSRRYCRAAAATGDSIKLLELPGMGHMEFLDPDSEAHSTLCRWLEALPMARATG